jgi:hypothetical protein
MRIQSCGQVGWGDGWTITQTCFWYEVSQSFDRQEGRARFAGRPKSVVCGSRLAWV